MKPTKKSGRKPTAKPHGKEPVIDEENPEWTDEMFAQAIPGRQFFTERLGPEAAEAFFARSRGRPKKTNPKVSVSLRVDRDVLEGYKTGGPGWQTRMNEALRGGLDTHGG